MIATLLKNKFLPGVILCLSIISFKSSAQLLTAHVSGLKYRIQQPIQKSNKAPLVVLLHGYGSNENDLISLASSFPENFYIVSVRAPQTIAQDSYAWYSLTFDNGVRTVDTVQAEQSTLQLLQFIDELKHMLPIDGSAIFLCGFSQGAILSYNIALCHPSAVRGIAAMSGRLPDGIQNRLATSAEMKHLRIFIAHGTKDKILPVADARHAKAMLESLKINFKYKEYAAAHEITEPMLHDLFSWISGK